MAASFSSHRNTDKHARKIRKNPQSSQEKNDLYPPYCKHRNFPITLRESEKAYSGEQASREELAPGMRSCSHSAPSADEY
jgi:hypothetical protein